MKSTLKPRIAVLVLFSILFPSGILGQLGFYEGYIVTDQNDSIFGKIGTYQKKQIIEYCILKKDGEEIKYYPNMINRFGFIDGTCYISNVLKDTIVQILVQGKLSLYKYQSSLYIRKEGNEVHKLETFTDKVIRNGEMYYVESVKWKGILTYLTADCITDQNEIINLHLLDTEITEFVVNYNKCTKSEFIDYSGKKQRKK
jgi:hypothetical protein